VCLQSLTLVGELKQAHRSVSKALARNRAATHLKTLRSIDTKFRNQQMGAHGARKN